MVDLVDSPFRNSAVDSRMVDIIMYHKIIPINRFMILKLMLVRAMVYDFSYVTCFLS
jgi:hypothetical protein